MSPWIVLDALLSPVATGRHVSTPGESRMKKPESESDKEEQEEHHKKNDFKISEF